MSKLTNATQRWRVMQVHTPCEACAKAAREAIEIANDLGHDGAHRSTEGNHAARVDRVTA